MLQTDVSPTPINNVSYSLNTVADPFPLWSQHSPCAVQLLQLLQRLGAFQASAELSSCEHPLCCFLGLDPCFLGFMSACFMIYSLILLKYIIQHLQKERTQAR